MVAGGGTNFECVVLWGGGIRCWGASANNLRFTHNDIPAEVTVPQDMQCDGDYCCALQDGKVYCWNSNRPPGNLPWIRSISVSKDYACALDESFTVHCWGNSNAVAESFNGRGQVAKTAAGWKYSCILNLDGTVECVGPADPQLNFGQFDVPSGLVDQVDIVTRQRHSCSISKVGQLTCWGDTSRGMLPVPSDLPPVKKVALGEYTTCVQLAEDEDQIRCWGDQDQAPSGVGLMHWDVAQHHGCAVYKITSTTTSSTSSSSSLTATSSTRTSITWTSSTVTTPGAGGDLVCWGEPGVPDNIPSDLGPVLMVAGGGWHLECVVPWGGGLRCWYRSEAEKIFEESDIPAAVTIPQDLQCDTKHCCALQDGKVYCWGERDQPPSNLPWMRSISVSHYHACGVDKSFVVHCWGTTHSFRTVLHGRTEVAKVAAGYAHNCILNLDGTVECAGKEDENEGQTTVPSGLVGQVDIVTKVRATCAISSAGKLTCWGKNEWGMLDIPSDLPPVKKVALGKYSTCVELASEEIRCWGRWNTPPSGVDLMSWNLGWYHGCAVYKITSTTTSSTTSSSSLTTTSTLTSVTASSSTRTSITWTSSTVTTHGAGGGLVCWGEQGVPDTIPSDLGPVLMVAGGGSHLECVVPWGGGLRCWARSEADKIFEESNIPAAAVTIPQDLQCDTKHCCALQDGKVYCWGERYQPPSSLPWMRSISVGHYHACGVDKSFVVHCWGDFHPFRKVFDGRTEVAKVAAGYGHNCILNLDGTVECGGKEDWEEGQTIVPSGLVGQVDIVTKAGKLTCWGKNEFGMLDIPSDLPPVKKVALGVYTTCVELASDDIRCWGQHNQPPSGVGLMSWSLGWYHGCAVYKITSTTTTTSSSLSSSSSTSRSSTKTTSSSSSSSSTSSTSASSSSSTSVTSTSSTWTSSTTSSSSVSSTSSSRSSSTSSTVSTSVSTSTSGTTTLSSSSTTSLTATSTVTSTSTTRTRTATSTTSASTTTSRTSATSTSTTTASITTSSTSATSTSTTTASTTVSSSTTGTSTMSSSSSSTTTATSTVSSTSASSTTTTSRTTTSASSSTSVTISSTTRASTATSRTV